ncbi:MAG: aminotransferase class V-fold PLP-dependent enzyme [bacterium]|nr:aminotransferase class V-fold PLP-dependent enzyme [bacterium]
MQTIDPLISPTEFVGLDGVTHLCTGGEAPWLREFEAVYADFSRLKSGGLAGRSEVYHRGERCRDAVGQLWGVPAERVGFLPCAAEGMNWLARGLDWQAGDNVVTDNLEFPSVAYAWRQLEDLGVEVRMVSHRDWCVHEKDLLEAMDARTRVVAVSQVSFYTGQNLDISSLAQGLRARSESCLLAVDSTHAAGVVRVPAAMTDLCISSSYKWLLATHGTAPCYVSERAAEMVTDSCFGWHNLATWPAQGAERQPKVAVQPMPARLEPGNPAMIVVLFLERALQRLLALGVDVIQDHAWDLSEQLEAGLRTRGRTVISPSTREARSGNTCFLHDDAEGLTEKLAGHDVLVWGQYGRVRVSGHLYNSSADVDRFLEVLDRIR